MFSFTDLTTKNSDFVWPNNYWYQSSTYSYTISTLESNKIAFNYDVEETEKAYVITAELPGVKKDDVNVKIYDKKLTITGEKVKDKTKKVIEGRCYGKFESTITLKENVIEDEITAEMENGILTIEIPKANVKKEVTIKIK